jgi:hypothetical protein
MSIRNSAVETNGWTTFDVPNQYEDLQKPLATGSYYVQNVLDLADINTRLQSNIKILSKSNFYFYSFSYLTNSRTKRITRHIPIILQYCDVKILFFYNSYIEIFPFLVILIKSQSLDVLK